MKIGILDADLLGRTNHRFPNLVCEKISGFWKEKSATVDLLTDYESFDSYDEIFVSKVFTDTFFPEELVNRKNVHIGGTGFYFDKAPNLPDEIEHHMPDYGLYDNWINTVISQATIEAEKRGKKLPPSFFNQFKEYQQYSIGFLTRGCFRKCKFCVNQKYDHVFMHSPIEEFFDPSRKKICLLDDNFFGCSQWKPLLEELISLDRPFKFKQGLDERILTDERCKLLFSGKYDGDYTFAFDNVADYDLIERKLGMIRKYTNSSSIKFYVLVGFESTDATDIENAFKRISLLMKYKCLPYIMRYRNKNDSPWMSSKYRGMYIAIARWANQPSFLKKKSFRQYCEANQDQVKTPGHISAPLKALQDFEKENPEIAKKYFDMRFDDQFWL
ncbi:MAG: hypothetical protein MJ057_01565 [Sphaerochaetaceae bacterium]|nr:hypothetical protein [Sphaerochaetaceae bacterium]